VGVIVSPAEAGVEDIVANAVLWLKLGIEMVGATVIGVGAILTSLRLAATADFLAARLSLASFLAIALEFQLGADILSTAVAPSWDAIGKLAAIAVIRTALNYFLGREMREETPGPKAPLAPPVPPAPGADFGRVAD
jgi:uncharacterized membrane protein